MSKLIDKIRADVATGYCTISARILKDNFKDLNISNRK
jgi:hypothetical protein